MDHGLSSSNSNLNNSNNNAANNKLRIMLSYANEPLVEYFLWKTVKVNETERGEDGLLQESQTFSSSCISPFSYPSLLLLLSPSFLFSLRVRLMLCAN